MKLPKINPCPYCGGVAHLRSTTTEFLHVQATVVCGGCLGRAMGCAFSVTDRAGISVDDFSTQVEQTKLSAIEQWNRLEPNK